MKNTLGFLIGRFQPLHAGHRDIIRQAARQCAELLIIVGSSNAAPSVKNPWSYKERRKKIWEFLDHENISNVKVTPINDYKYNDPQWMTDVNSLIDNFKKDFGLKEVTMFGFDKPDNKYLTWFPQYKFVNLKSNFNVCATDVRNSMFMTKQTALPEEVVEDWNYFRKEKEQFADYPYPETLNFNCSDSIVECNGHILLIKRTRAPGRNHWALPGGFKEQQETFLDCALRELDEETNLRVPKKVLLGSIACSKMYDSPSRASMGIPRSTYAFYFKIKPDVDGNLPRVSPADDALEAQWVSLSDALNVLPMHDDHRDIISELTGTKPIPAFYNLALY
jgi:bifunctional NMN adenylyltransferase/nudix hydrolase